MRLGTGPQCPAGAPVKGRVCRRMPAKTVKYIGLGRGAVRRADGWGRCARWTPMDDRRSPTQVAFWGGGGGVTDDVADERRRSAATDGG